VGVTMRKDLLASLVKVTGLAVDVSTLGMQMQYEWSARSSAAVVPRVLSIFA
jgi:hypothetical protein